MAVNVTRLPMLKLFEQIAPQLIPAGVLVTVPIPTLTIVTPAVVAGAWAVPQATFE
jgi:hypothetical protein